MTRRLVLVRSVPGYPLNVGAADADVGKLAVAQARQFAQALIVTLPFLDEANEGGDHDVLSFSRKVRHGGRSIGLAAK